MNKKKSPSSPFRGKTILLGVTGSIAACKAADLASQLTKAGAEVHCVMTAEACEFITPLTLQTLSRHPVTTSLFKESPGEWQPGHIALADRADLFLVAPATAHVIARMALGLADDALTCIALATRAPILMAPAMNGNMWLHPATTAHVKTLRSRGVHFTGPAEGLLACGYEGVGRMIEVQEILAAAQKLLH